MLNKLYLSKLLLSSLLVGSSLYAGNNKCEDCHDPVKQNAAALHYTVSKPNSQEAKYWDDYIHSGNKDITVYVRDLSRKDAQAALWFITTGGKYGFAAREATAQERVLLEDAIKQVAISYSAGANNGKGLQEWSRVSNANHAGHLHLQMIYKQIDDLKSEVKTLNVKVGLLEKANKEGLEEIKLIREEAKQAKSDSDNKFNNIVQLLKEETAARTKSTENFTQTIKDQMDRLPGLMKPMIDEIRDMAKQSENKWTLIWEELKAEKDKDRQEKMKLTDLIDQNQKAAETKLADQQKEADRLLKAQEEKAITEKDKLQKEKDEEKKRLEDERDTQRKKKKNLKKDLKKLDQQAAIAAVVENERAAATESLRLEREKIAERERLAVEREKRLQQQLEATRAGLLHLGRAHTKQHDISVEQILDSMNG